MTVALLTDGLWPYVMGGMQKHSYYMAKYLAKAKIKVVVLLTIPDDSEGILIEDFFSEDELAYIEFQKIQWPKLGAYIPLHYLYENYVYSKYIYRYLVHEIEKFDLIYAQGFTGWYLLNQNHQHSLKIVVNFHGINMFQKASSFIVKLQHLTFRSFVKINLRRAEISVSLGGKLTNILYKYSNKVEIIPIGIEKKWVINRSDLKKSEHQMHFVFIGRYDKVKGIEELQHVIPLLEGNFHFDFIGPIPERNRISNPNVHYHGSIQDEATIMQLLRQADVLVCPSWSEGMPTVILEAMASGCAILATDVGAVSEIVDEQNGWLIEPGNKEMLLCTLNKVIRSTKEDILGKKQNSIAKVGDYTWENVMARTIKQLLGDVEDSKVS